MCEAWHNRRASTTHVYDALEIIGQQQLSELELYARMLWLYRKNQMYCERMYDHDHEFKTVNAGDGCKYSSWLQIIVPNNCFIVKLNIAENIYGNNSLTHIPAVMLFQ